MAGSDLGAPHIVELPAQPAIAVRLQQPMSELDLGELFGRFIPAVFERAAAVGATPAGPPYGRYHEFGPERVDVEIGVPVAASPAASKPLSDSSPGEVGASELPGGRAATVTHLGSYDTLGETYDRLREWISREGHAAGDGPWESYVDSPEDVEDVSRVRTELYWPLG